MRELQDGKWCLDRAGVDYEQIDIDRDPAAVDIVLAINGGYRTVPTILLPNGRVLVEPGRRELLSALGLPQPKLVDQLRPRSTSIWPKLYGFTVCRVRCSRSSSAVKLRGRKPMDALAY